jgi:DNA-binding NarL/FixJ family response regulator
VGSTVHKIAEGAIPRGRRRIRVLIADETPLGCQLLKRVLGAYRKIEVAGTVSSVKDLLAELKRAPIDSVLINVNLQEGRLSGLQSIDELHASHPAVPVILLCDYASDDLVINSFRAGARGLVCRSESIGVLYKCIQVVYSGQIWARDNHLQVLLRSLAMAPPARAQDSQGLNLLAKREGQVVSLVADGLTNREIAAKLGLSEHTVSNYLFRVYNKLGISNRIELVLYVMKQSQQSKAAAS